MIIEMNPSVKKVAEYMQRELNRDELLGVAQALAVVAPAIWGGDVETRPLHLSERPIGSDRLVCRCRDQLPAN